MTDGICFVGLDVHARKTAAAAVQLGSGEVFKAQLSGAPADALRWLATLPGPVRAVYEAGPRRWRATRLPAAEMSSRCSSPSRARTLTVWPTRPGATL